MNAASVGGDIGVEVVFPSEPDEYDLIIADLVNAYGRMLPRARLGRSVTVQFALRPHEVGMHYSTPVEAWPLRQAGRPLWVAPWDVDRTTSRLCIGFGPHAYTSPALLRRAEYERRDQAGKLTLISVLGRALAADAAWL